MCSPEEFINAWIGTRHLYDGRDKNGVDCYGLVWLYYHDVLNMTLPDWSCDDSSRLWVSRAMDAAIDSSMVPIHNPVDSCIVLAKRKVVAHHVGIFYKGSVLHAVEKSSVVFHPLYVFNTVYGKLTYGVPDEKSIVKP